MKNIRMLALPVLITSFLFSCTNAPESDKAKTSEAKEVTEQPTSALNLKVDTTASKVEWVATKVSGYHTGTVPVKSGDLQVNGAALSGGTIVLNMQGMVVSGPEGSKQKDNDKLLNHLRSGDFFEVEKHPEAIFQITGVQAFTGQVKDTTDPRQEEISEYKVADPTHTVSGNLTMKGITKNVEFPARITVNGDSVEALAKFNVDRKQWGIVYPGKPDDLIRDDIHLGISLKAHK